MNQICIAWRQSCQGGGAGWIVGGFISVFVAILLGGGESLFLFMLGLFGSGSVLAAIAAYGAYIANKL